MNSSNIIFLEHINLTITEAGEPTTVVGKFYLNGLRAARDSRLNWMIHANIGQSQFHILPNQPYSQKINGCIGLYYSNLDELKRNISEMAHEFSGSRFEYEEIQIENNTVGSTIDMLPVSQSHIRIVGPNGNIFRCFKTPEPYKDIYHAFRHLPGGSSLGDGVPYIEFLCRPHTALSISSFYESYLGASTELKKSNFEEHLKVVLVHCGPHQTLILRETDEQLEPYDGHHICIYIDRFEEAYSKFQKDKLNWNNPKFQDRCDTWEQVHKEQQFRFLRIVDPTSFETVFELEHEVRSRSHPKFPLVPL